MNTSELYRLCDSFNVDDRILVNLKRGLRARIGRVMDNMKFVGNFREGDSSLVIDVTDYSYPYSRALEIRGTTPDGYEVEVSLSQFRDLIVLGPSCDFQTQAA